MKRTVVYLFMVFAGGTFPRAAFADSIVYSNGAVDTNTNNGFSLDTVTTGTQFTLSTAFAIDGIVFDQWPKSPPASGVYWAIYSDSGNRPGTLEYSGLTTDYQTTQESGYVQVDVTIDPVTLDSSTYWLMLHDGDPNSSGPETGYNALASLTPGTVSSYYQYATYWSSDQGWYPSGPSNGPQEETAFELLGGPSTPEPASALLMLGGALFLASRRFFRA